MGRWWVYGTAILGLGCGGSATPAADDPSGEAAETEIALEEVSTVPEPLPERPPRAPRPEPEPPPPKRAELPKACKRYLDAMMECFEKSAPPGAQDILKPVMENMAEQWREMIEADASAAAALAETCEMISDSLANSPMCLPGALGPIPPTAPPLGPIPPPGPPLAPPSPGPGP